MASVPWKDVIASDPEILRANPASREHGYQLSLILGHLAAGQTPQQIIGEFPDLTLEQIASCLDYARALSEFEVEV